LTAIFTTIDHIPALLKSAPKTPQLRLIVSLDTLTPETSRIFTEWGQLHNILVKDLKESAHPNTYFLTPSHSPCS
jgi:long-chain acyl-CoA synthetase